MIHSKKGFTLVELLGVILVMSIILLVGVPTITNMMKQDKIDTYERYLKDLYAASESYFVAHKDQYPSLNTVGGKATVTVSKLTEEGYIKNNVVDPKTNHCQEIQELK